MGAISFDGVTKEFDETIALADFTLDIADGEFLVLLGPSGCGKSTALRILAGLEQPTSGTVSIDGQVVNDVDARHRDVAMVFQSYALYPHMTVAKNIESPLIGRRAERTTKAARTEAVERAASMLGLSEVLDRKPAQLSGGQRQRVALARAIVRRPSVFLMDEPLSNLDAKLRSETRTELVELHQRLGATFVYVTHDQVEAMTMATEIAVLEQGRLQQVATPRMLYDAPANVFVARFIGNPPMNVLPGDVWPGQDSTALIGIRPEDLALTTGSGADSIAATVVGREWLGHEQIVELDVGGHRVSLRVPDQAGAAPSDDLHLGDTVHVTGDPAAMHRFDATSGERLGTAGAS